LQPFSAQVLHNKPGRFTPTFYRRSFYTRSFYGVPSMGVFDRDATRAAFSRGRSPIFPHFWRVGVSGKWVCWRRLERIDLQGDLIYISSGRY